ncbi:MAG: hypothetical protein LBS79_01840 [Tannerella sp.]|jgi:hypothetical protein|nr:hypothetical protein [Tannerella sp.]
MTVEETLNALNIIPDVKLGNSDFVYAHRTTAVREIYFVANRSEKSIRISPGFRVAGHRPERWSPVNGERRPLAHIRTEGSFDRCPLAV